MNEQQRSFSCVPKTVIWLLVLSLGLQIIGHYKLLKPQNQIQALTSPPQVELLRLFSLGDSVVGAKIFMLWLQVYGNQSGQFLSYQELNYENLRQWLERILLIDPKSQYPLLAASHIYYNVKDSNKQRQMLEFVYQQFFIEPQQRWRWLAHATVLAKHKLKDLPLALKYAKAIADHASPEMPYWAKEMQIFILEDMGELEQAQLLIGGMLASGQVTDPNEVKYLNNKLNILEKQTIESYNIE